MGTCSFIEWANLFLSSENSRTGHGVKAQYVFASAMTSFRALIPPPLYIQRQQKLEKRWWREGKGLKICICTSWLPGLKSWHKCGAILWVRLEDEWTGWVVEPSWACSKVMGPQLGAIWWGQWVPHLNVQPRPSNPLLVGLCILPHRTASSSPLSLTAAPHTHTLTHVFEEVVFCVLQTSFSLNDLLASAFAKNLVSDYPGLLTVIHVCVFILMFIIFPRVQKSL